METVTNFIFLGSKISADGDCSHEIKDTCSLEEKLWPTSVQFNSVTQSCLTLYNPIGYSMPGCNVQHKLPELAQLLSIELMMPSNLLIFCSPLLLPPSIFPSIRNFSSESVLRIRWPKCWSFSFSICPSNAYSGLMWLDLLAVQGTLKSLLQHHSSKATILWHSAVFIAQLLHPYMTTGKTTALTRWTFVGKHGSAF